MVLPGVLASQPCHGTVGWLVRRYETGTGDMETWRHGDMETWMMDDDDDVDGWMGHEYRVNVGGLKG